MSDLEEDQDESVGNNSKQEEEEHDGFANVMSKILQQEVGTKGPILAKRKTTIMKAIENEKNEKTTLKKLQNSRQIEKQKFLVIPDQSTADYERQLRKLATRGIVALFNAITKAKKEVSDIVEHDSNKNNDTSSSNSNVKKMTQANFLDLLKSKLTANSSTTTTNKNNNNNDNNNRKNDSKQISEDDDDDPGYNEKEIDEEPASQNWSVLKDTYDLNELTNDNNEDSIQDNKSKDKLSLEPKSGFSFKSRPPTKKSYSASKSGSKGGGSSSSKKQRTK